jgi:protein gp37
MGEKTGITWCHHTFNPWWGCTRISPGCDNCYADAWARRTGFKLWDGGPRRFFGQTHWDEPLKWNAAAAEAGERRRVFCGSMCDVFERTGSELTAARVDLFRLIQDTRFLDWLLLTKRPENISEIVPERWRDGWPSNIWIGTTVENQDALARCDWLLQCPASVRFLSCEPLLGRLRFANFDGIHWIIVGCEKLPRNLPGRRCELAGIRDLVMQARAAGVAVFVKQLEVKLRVSADPADWPEDLRIQEFP